MKKPTRRHWSWYVSSVFYRLSYIDLVRVVNEDLFAYLDDRVRGARVVDCGCGPGVIMEQLLERGAQQVIGVDGNHQMLEQAGDRLQEHINAQRACLVQARFSQQLIPDIRARYNRGDGFDLILFMRSLYLPTRQANEILKSAAGALAPGGELIIIHGEKRLKKYAFGPGWKVERHTPYHLVNRFFSRLGVRLGIGEYALYTREELLELAARAAPGHQVKAIPSRQEAYNLVVVGMGE